MIRHSRTRALAAALLIGASALAISPQSALAQTADGDNVTRETNRYNMRLMLQVFDGNREFSHNQVAGFARMREGDESWVAVNFGDGAVVIDRGKMLQVGRFRNTSGTEAGMRYNYATRTLTGDGPVAAYHNRYVRPQLGHAPALGRDASWETDLSLRALGFEELPAAPVSIAFSRQYLTYAGKPLVLLRYRVPSFSYRANGRTIVQWGEGAALTDPGFGEVYWNAALHRAVAQQAGASGQPYRLLKTMGAVDDKGAPLIDPRKVPEVAPLLAHFYGPSAKEVLSFAANGQADGTPVNIANRLDVMALSIVEDSANQTGEVTSAYTTGGRGNEQSTGQKLGEALGGLNTAITYADKSSAVLGALDKAINSGTAVDLSPDIIRGLVQLTNDAVGMQPKIEQAFAAAQAAQQRLEDVRKLGPLTSPEIESTTAKLTAAQSRLGAANAEVDYIEMIFEGDKSAPTQQMTDGLRSANAQQDAAQQSYNAAKREYEAALSAAQKARDAQIDKAITEAKALGQKALDLEKSVETTLGTRMKDLTARITALPAPKLHAMVNWLNESSAGKVFAGVTHTLNAMTSAQAITNFYQGTTKDLSGGKLPLTRTYAQSGYGSLGGSVLGLTLDIGSLAANTYSGNVAGVLSDGQAIVLGSVGDIIVSMKGVYDTNMEVARIREEGLRLQQAAFDQARAKRLADLAGMEADLDNIKASLDDLASEGDDEQTKLAKILLAERQANREKAERQRQAEEARLIEEARLENERLYQENLKRPPTQEEWDQFDRDIAEAMKPDYPTAEPPTPEEIAARLQRAEEKRLADAEAAEAIAAAEAQKLADEEAERQRKAGELAQAQEEAKEKREEEKEKLKERWKQAEERGLDISPLEISPFDIQPVTFTPPVWVPPKFDPPVWVPPEFDAPDPMTFDWTNFADDDYPGGNINLAFQYDDMSGKVATDLAPWADWLATQDQRRLERLAKNAGYPNLASALADADNLIRQARDQGYRDWANQAPSCGGTVGCGPSYLERWSMKLATVSLGDILNASRDVFSSGGLTDIGISGNRLAYLLRDHGVEDGDIIDVEITQFGRILYQKQISLTNAGENFNIPLQRGVAGMTVFAVNEGTLQPNTAQVTIDNIVRGEATQQYSLRRGEFATQRIEVGAEKTKP